MNYLETGLPHQDLYRKKSDFVPPRYKPLCSLGRRYLGLEPPSKREITSFINRLCQPKKPPEPEDPRKFTQKVRPIVPGSGRFNGRKRMTGDQIKGMVERLTKRKTEPKQDPNENAIEPVSEHDNDRYEEEEYIDEKDDNVAASFREMPNASPRRSIVKHNTEGSHLEKSVHFERKESTVSHSNINQWLDSARSQEENGHGNTKMSANQDGVGMNQPIGNRVLSVSEKQQKRNKEQAEDEEERYESLYYRGVKTETARKAFLQHKRSSVQMGRSNRADSAKSAKTDIHVYPSSDQHPHMDDVTNRRVRVKTS